MADGGRLAWMEVVRRVCDDPVGFGWVEMKKKRGRSGGEVVRGNGGIGCCSGEGKKGVVGDLAGEDEEGDRQEAAVMVGISGQQFWWYSERDEKRGRRWWLWHFPVEEFDRRRGKARSEGKREREGSVGSVVGWLFRWVWCCCCSPVLMVVSGEGKKRERGGRQMVGSRVNWVTRIKTNGQDVIDEDLNFRDESTNVPSSTNGNFNMRKAANSFYIPEYSKGPLGEDAHIICIEGETIGIADGVGKHVFLITVNLARDTRLAFAPVVLASIYRDLSLLKQTMIMASSNDPSSNGDDGDKFNILEFSLWAPLFFVRVWAWERLLPLQPEQAQNYNMVIAVKIGRWHNVKQSGVINVRTTIDSSRETIQWRPYALAVECWILPKFYNEKKEWAIVEGQNLDQELESFIRCLRMSELVDLDCQEPYRPNRVTMQFGYDQYFPKWILRSPSSPEVAWYNYSKPIDSDLRLYYPSRLSESNVTSI
ncbi:hypothetical protein HAX54_005411 [Datura stramonium]|uniref:Aminotransferase-like plant mobile domain-containing protein n=1 Tax=Datura stramonium TaxID=4076 RepID=A0ABS8TB45_DATST|nr:hypothetical protein [Datura stramonium]